MDLTRVSENTVRLAFKKGVVLLDPDTFPDAVIAIVTDDAGKYETTEDTLIIEGPGEYETKGIVVKGSRAEGAVVYELDSGEGKIMFAQSTSLAKLADEDEFDAVLIKVVEELDEAKVTSLSSGLTIIYGPAEFVPAKIRENTVTKINLKKKEELGANIVYLAKK